MLTKLWKYLRNNRHPDPLLYTANDIWAKAETITSFDFDVRHKYRVIEVGNITLEFRGDWGRTPDLRITINGARVFDAAKPARKIHVQVFRPGAWLIELDQLWRVAETKRRLQKIIKHRRNFDPI